MRLKFKSLILSLPLAACSITLWLIESSLKYVFYLFEATLILILLYFLLGKNVRIKFYSRVDITTVFDYVFLAISMVLLTFNIFKLNSLFTLVCAIIVSFFLPGYVLLRLLKFHRLESWIEWPVLSFTLSVSITSTIFTIVLPFAEERGILLSAIYAGISVCPLLIDRIYKSSKEVQVRSKDYNLFETLLLLWIILFFIFAISNLYPRMALRPALDIVEHFSFSRLLALAPYAYSSDYPWFHATWATVYELSSPSMDVYQTGLAYLSIMVIFSFYVMANIYLKDIDRRTPILATIFFSIFAGFGWLYFLNQRITNADFSLYYKLLSETSDKSYWDVGFSQGWIWLWYRPLTLGLTLLFVLLSLLRDRKLNRKVFIFVSSLILLTLILVHFPEAVVFIVFLLFLSLLKPNIELKLKEMIISSFIALFISFIFDAGLTIVSLSQLELLFLIVICIISMFLTRLEKRPKIRFASFPYWFASGLGTIMYIWLIVAWFITAKDFSVWCVSTVLGVPWQFYPVILGLSGLLAISASLLIIEYYSKHPVIVFILLLTFIIPFGRIVTYLNINILNTGYWERRLILIAYAAASLLAPISILELLKHAQAKKNVIIAISLLISCLVISGITSTFLTLDLQNYYTSRYALGKDNLRVIDVLNSLPADKVLLTVTDSSLSVAGFTPCSWRINYYRYQIWSAKYPELPLNVLYSMNRPVCLLLREPDLQEISKKYASSYLSIHFLPIFMESYLKKGANVMLLPKMVAPYFDGETMLVLPKDQNPSIWYAYDILSLANYNYTTVLMDDIAMLSRAKTLVAPTENIAMQLIQLKELFNLSFKNLLILNLDGYGKLATDYFSGAKMVLSLDKDSEEKAYLLIGGSPTNNITLLAAPLQFEIRSKLSNSNMFTLLDDDLDGWVTTGIGSGNISIPRIGLNNENKIFGNASIYIDVESGSYGYWQIAKTLPKPINVDEFDFISFYWYGRGDGKNYVLNFHSTSGNYWYSFKDTWRGWKKVLIPMHIPDGRYTLNGVFFVKATNRNASWSDIRRVEIRNEGSNPNVSGFFLIDNFGFESALSINVGLIAHGSFQAFRLLNFDGKSWNDVFELKPDVLLQTSNFTSMNGVSSRTLFGERPSLSAKMSREQNTYYVKIYIKLPPCTDDICFSSVKMMVVPTVQGFKVKGILNETSSILFPKEITTLPLVTDKTVISWYDGYGKVPFSITDNLNELRLVYINIYPLILDIISDSSNYEILSKVLDIGGASSFIQKAQTISENPVQGNLATFQKIEFKGDTTMFSRSSIIVESADSTLELEYDGIRISNILKIVFFQGNNTLKMKNGSISQGYGFYSNIRATNLTINSDKRILGKCLLELNNGSSQLIDIATYEIKIMGGSNVLMRQPTICIEGDSNFSKLYTYAILSKSIGILGYDATLQGKLIFKTIYGDTFTVVNNFIYEGKIISDYRKYNYDELSPLKQSFHILIVMFLFYLAVFLSIRLMEENKNWKL